jgi:hypothetical protein
MNFPPTQVFHVLGILGRADPMWAQCAQKPSSCHCVAGVKSRGNDKVFSTCLSLRLPENSAMRTGNRKEVIVKEKIFGMQPKPEVASSRQNY